MTAHFTLPRQRAEDDSGNPVSGAKLYFFDVGTTNPRTVYQDFALTTAHGVFVQADANGVFDPIYPPNGDYDVVMTDGSDAGNDYTAETVIRAKISTQGPVDLTAFQTTSAKSETPAITKATDYTIVEADRGKAIDVNPNSATVTITLESAAVAGDGAEQTIKHIGTSNAVLIATVGSEDIDDKTGLALTRPNSSVTIRSDGANWKIKVEALPNNVAHHIITDRSLLAPPTSPTVGAMYIMPTGTLTGVWSGFSVGDLVIYLGSAGYHVTTVLTGDRAYIVDEGFDAVWDGSAWVDHSNTIAPQASNLKTATFEYRVSSGTEGGSAVNNAWTNRNLNYANPDNNIDGMSLDLVTNPGRVTIPAGKYWVHGTQAHSFAGALRVSLKSTSTSKIFESANLTTNTSLLSNASLSDICTLAVYVELTAEEDFEFCYYRTSNNSIQDLGRKLDNGDDEIYATLSFIDLGSLQGPQGVQGVQGNAGADGSNGSNGADGSDGADGADGVSNFYSQEAEPAGNDGDIWVKSSTGIVYKKISGTWTATATDLTGPTGATGATGATGPAGADGSGTGDVVGPASATDNAIPRFDATTGKLVQNSGIIVDDSNNVTGMGTLNSRNLSTDGAKLDGIEASADVTDETNVKAALDGATLTAVTVATTDKVIVQDVSDSDNIKTVTAQSIADLAAAGSSQISAWINYNSTGTISIIDSYNISSITDNGAGDITINFATALANADYGIAGSIAGGTTHSAALPVVRSATQYGAPTTKTTAACRILTYNYAGGAKDPTNVYIVFFGGV